MRGPLLVTAMLVLLLAAAPPAQARRDCGVVMVNVGDLVVVTGISADCATARRVARRWGRKDACRDDRCRVRGWRCKPRGARSRCARAQTPRQVLELRFRPLIID